MAGSHACLIKPASFSTCLTISAGSETFHSIGVSLDRRQLDASKGWRVKPNWWLGSEQSKDESDESDGIAPGIIAPGITPGPIHPSFPSPASKMYGEHGLGSANGLGRAR